MRSSWSRQCCGEHQVVYVYTLKCRHWLSQAPKTLTYFHVHSGWQLPEMRRGRAVRRRPPLTAVLQGITSLRSLTYVRDMLAGTACIAVPAGNSGWTSLLFDSRPGRCCLAAAAAADVC